MACRAWCERNKIRWEEFPSFVRREEFPLKRGRGCSLQMRLSMGVKAYGPNSWKLLCNMVSPALRIRRPAGSRAISGKSGPLEAADEPRRRAPLRNLLSQGQGLRRACCQGAARRLKVRNPIRADAGDPEAGCRKATPDRSQRLYSEEQAGLAEFPEHAGALRES